MTPFYGLEMGLRNVKSGERYSRAFPFECGLEGSVGFWEPEVPLATPFWCSAYASLLVLFLAFSPPGSHSPFSLQSSSERRAGAWTSPWGYGLGDFTLSELVLNLHRCGIFLFPSFPQMFNKWVTSVLMLSWFLNVSFHLWNGNF